MWTETEILIKKTLDKHKKIYIYYVPNGTYWTHFAFNLQKHVEYQWMLPMLVNLCPLQPGCQSQWHTPVWQGTVIVMETLLACVRLVVHGLQHYLHAHVCDFQIIHEFCSELSKSMTISTSTTPIPWSHQYHKGYSLQDILSNNCIH